MSSCRKNKAKGVFNLMSRKIKQTILIVFDVLVIVVSGLLAYEFLNIYVRLSTEDFWLAIFLSVIIYLVLAMQFDLYHKITRYTSIRETVYHVLAITISFLISSILVLLLTNTISFRFMILTYIFSLGVIPASRIVWRVIKEYQDRDIRLGKEPIKKTRTIIVGAGSGGSMFIKSLQGSNLGIEILGVVDDSKSSQEMYVYGVPIIGYVSELPELVEKYHADQVTIAIPSLQREELERIIEIAHETHVKINKMPSIEKVIAGEYTVNEFQEIDVVDLLGRDEVKLDMNQIAQQVSGKTILVTGAGGSIGSEISRQLLRFSPKHILLLGHGENSIYSIHRELQSIKGQVELVPLIADIQDRNRIFQIMAEYQPNLVYHAAAHKHVPLMEYNPKEAIKNNIYGTKNVAEAAKSHGVESFVMISTDKAVNPPNVMGASKRIAEMLVTGLNETGYTNFVAVRFGNVLGSRGSVIPLFKEQIKQGGPITVTDFRMTRYFMTIPEASRLVLQAGALARGGELFVLDMDEPVKIIDLAKKMIQLSGHTEEEIKIVESGIRPGEKLYEELLAADEATHEEVYDKIFIGQVEDAPIEEVMEFVESLDGLANEELKERLVAFANHKLDEDCFD